jgi:hypothetical protein
MNGCFLSRIQDKSLYLVVGCAAWQSLVNASTLRSYSSLSRRDLLPFTLHDFASFCRTWFSPLCRASAAFTNITER